MLLLSTPDNVGELAASVQIPETDSNVTLAAEAPKGTNPSETADNTSDARSHLAHFTTLRTSISKN